MKPFPNRFLVAAAAWIVLAGAASPARAGDADLAAAIADRTAVERVYYSHREGTKPPFDELLPAAAVKELVQRDLEKERLLKERYGVEISDAEVSGEARRIDSATRAPGVLAELKQVLGGDSARFGRTVVKPILVEKRLRGLFQKDGAANEAERDKAGQLRAHLLAVAKDQGGPERLLEALRSAGEVLETTWLLDPKEKPRPVSQGASPLRTVATSPSYSAEAAVRWTGPRQPAAVSIEELRPELQALLRSQLVRPGAVSAVVETDSDFVLFLARERTERILRAAYVRIPKQTYASWLSREIRPATTPAISQ